MKTPMSRAAAMAFALCAIPILCPSAQAQTYTPHLLHNFTNSPDGYEAQATVLRDAHGNLFGLSLIHISEPTRRS